MENYGFRVFRKLKLGVYLCILQRHKDWLGPVKTGYCQLVKNIKLELTEDQTAVMVRIG